MTQKSRFYLRGLSGEKLHTPIHIHFDSFETSFSVDPSARLNPGSSFDCFGTFLVTLNSPDYEPKGLTCRVSGVNHKLSQRGVVDGVVAHVEMVKDLNEGPIERVHVALREDGGIIGHRENSNGYEEANLEEVYFSHGDTVFLDGDGNPFSEKSKPGATGRQIAFMREEEEKTISEILDR